MNYYIILHRITVANKNIPPKSYNKRIKLSKIKFKLSKQNSNLKKFKMKVNFRNLMIAATLVAGFASCSSDDDSTNGGITPTGEKTTFNLTIAQPRTYAVDPNATDDESTVNSIDVFIFNANDVLEKREHLDVANFTNTNGQYTNNQPIVSTTGAKKIYAGVNLTDALAREISSNGLAAIYKAENASKLMGSEGFAMFSKLATPATFVADNDASAATANQVSVSVARLLSKVSVLEGQSLKYDVVGGKVSDLYFSVSNIATLYNILPSQSNVGPANSLSDFYKENSYKAVNALGKDILESNVSYALENTSGKGRQGYSTYASIRAKFIPSKVVKLAIAGDASSDLVAETAPTVAKTFYTVMNAGVRYYFLDKDDATAYDNAINTTASIKEYTDGFSYYKAYLNPSDDFKIYRNNLYKVNIIKVNGIGDNTDNGEDNGEDPEDKVPSPTNITVTVTVEDWVENTQNTEI